MVYVDYEYYRSTYYGTLPEDSFNKMVLKASREIDNNVNTRLNQEKIDNLPKEAQEQLKYTACALVDLISKQEESYSKKVSSISIDGVNKTYKDISNSDIKKDKQKALDCLPDELTKYL